MTMLHIAKNTDVVISLRGFEALQIAAMLEEPADSAAGSMAQTALVSFFRTAGALSRQCEEGDEPRFSYCKHKEGARSAIIQNVNDYFNKPEHGDTHDLYMASTLESIKDSIKKFSEEVPA